MFSILGAIAGYELQGIIVSIATSFIGSYLTIRSLSVLFGGFPNEFDLGHRLQTGVYDGIAVPPPETDCTNSPLSNVPSVPKSKVTV